MKWYHWLIIVIVVLVISWFVYQNMQKKKLEKQKSELVDKILAKYPQIDTGRDFLMAKDLSYLQDVYDGKIK